MKVILLLGKSFKVISFSETQLSIPACLFLKVLVPDKQENKSSVHPQL